MGPTRPKVVAGVLWDEDQELFDSHVTKCESILSGTHGFTNRRFLSRLDIPVTLHRLEALFASLPPHSNSWLARRVFVEWMNLMTEAYARHHEDEGNRPVQRGARRRR